MNEIVLSTSGLCRRFGAIEVTRNVTFELKRGARHALIGPNGAGKTTFVNLLAGSLTPDSGSIKIEGEEVSHFSQRARAQRGLARTFQINRLFRDLTVFENILISVSQRVGASSSFWRKPSGNRELITRTTEVMTQLQLKPYAFRKVGELPYGIQRLVEISIALGMAPSILLMDEPAAGVPGDEMEAILSVIGELSPDMAILIIEHNMEIVFRFAREITVLLNGAVFTRGTPEDVAKDPQVRKIYLGGGSRV